MFSLPKGLAGAMFLIASDLIVARVAGDLDIPPLGLSSWRCSVR